eukprot:TRINITY_DN50914_c0_g1_i1.p1 TRINITY_DN50914_c0_g1~~TRINITY_DN50914_c0_g1_i1.p1  ORF type:complete len:186 (-),score=34.85 TRINITY_DN50914_c0_g1_i1:359-916(-)
MEMVHIDGVPFKVILTVDDDAFVESEDGEKQWVPRSLFQQASAPLKTGGLQPKGSSQHWSSSRVLIPQQPTSALCVHKPCKTTSQVRCRCASRACPGGAVVLRGLLDAHSVRAIHSTAHSAFSEEWGTVRRRSVGASEQAVGATPYQTHIRLTRHFQEHGDQHGHRAERAQPQGRGTGSGGVWSV